MSRRWEPTEASKGACRRLKLKWNASQLNWHASNAKRNRSVGDYCSWIGVQTLCIENS